MARSVKRVKVEEGTPPTPSDRDEAVSPRIDGVDESTEFPQQGDGARRSVRSQYSSIRNIINERSYDIGNSESNRFKKIMGDVEGLFQSVTWPREQVADAETVLGLTGTLVASVQSHLRGTITPAQFISHFLKHYKRRGGRRKNAVNILPWKEIGSLLSPIFMDGSGCKTMFGPLSYKIKLERVDDKIKPDPLKYVVKLRGIRNEIKRRTRCTPYARPAKLFDSTAEWKSNTEKNVSVMFEAIEEEKSVKLENLVLNRISYAQTIENIFALSFLVKDGRVAISMAENGSYFVSTKGASCLVLPNPTDAVYNNSIFRFDYIDWKVMLDVVPEGEELMPHRAPLGFRLS